MLTDLLDLTQGECAVAISRQTDLVLDVFLQRC